MDVVALAQYGIEYAVAALGTATTPFHITKLMRQADEIVFCFDGDNAGRTAAWRAAMNALPALTDGLKMKFLFLPKEHDPDSYIREFGKEKFEAEIKTAMPLSQYIVRYLSADNPLNSDEDKIKLLSDVKPILLAIEAPLSGLYLRKKIAELAGISEGELQEKLKLPNLNKSPVQARPKLTRTTNSLHHHFCLTMIMQPELVDQADLLWLAGSSDDEILLRLTIETCLGHPHSKPVVIMRELESKVDAKVITELKKELSVLDETLDLAQDLAGARQQLKQLYSHKNESALLAKVSEKPLSALTDEERSLLKTLGSKPKVVTSK